MTIYGDGHQSRDFVYVGDVVAAILAALQRPLTGVSVLNVGTGRQTDLLQILGVVEQQCRADASSGAWSRRARATSAHSRADAGRARWVLGWEAGTTLAAGLAETWAWFAGADAGVRERRGRRAGGDAWLAARRIRSAPCPSAAAPRWPCSR